MDQVVTKLKAMITKTTTATENHLADKLKLELSSNYVNNVDNSSNINNSLYGVLVNFDKMEIEPTTVSIKQDINETILDLSIVVIDELVNFIFKEINEGKEESVRKQHVLGYIKNHKMTSQEIYNLLLNNQNYLKAIYLLGYFNYHGIETDMNKQNAFELFQKAAEIGNNAAQLDLTDIFIHGKGVVDKDYSKAFELCKKLAEKEYPCGMLIN